MNRDVRGTTKKKAYWGGDGLGAAQPPENYENLHFELLLYFEKNTFSGISFTLSLSLYCLIGELKKRTLHTCIRVGFTSQIMK